jgi:hypothetical protein
MRTAIKHTRWAIVQHWLTSPDKARFAPRLNPDYGFPHCFVCGWLADHREPGFTGTAWGKTGLGLERAHIVPQALGGSDEPDNLIVMCTVCHEESPDWHDVSAMERWIAGQPERYGRTWDLWMEREPVLRRVMDDYVITDFDEADMLRHMRDAYSRAGTHGSKISLGTFESILRETCSKVFHPVQPAP